MNHLGGQYPLHHQAPYQALIKDDYPTTLTERPSECFYTDGGFDIFLKCRAEKSCDTFRRVATLLRVPRSIGLQFDPERNSRNLRPTPDPFGCRRNAIRKRTYIRVHGQTARLEYQCGALNLAEKLTNARLPTSGPRTHEPYRCPGWMATPCQPSLSQWVCRIELVILRRRSSEGRRRHPLEAAPPIDERQIYE